MILEIKESDNLLKDAINLCKSIEQLGRIEGRLKRADKWFWRSCEFEV